MRKALLSIVLLSTMFSLIDWDGQLGVIAASDTYYVRPDGGPPGECSGLVDAPYTLQDKPDCAWDHPFRALPPGGLPRISGGDTLIIKTGSYMMGYGAPGADSCSADYPWDCHMALVPSGPDPGHPTRVLGEGWGSGCLNPPELWGTERADMIINLTDSSNVEITCLELTDHSGCVEFHTGGLACERTSYPYGPWAAIGIYAEDSTDVHLKYLNIHGFADRGALAGRLTDWTVEDVRIAGNGWAGWDGDIYGDDSNSGTLTFRRWTVEWNGCAETYPGEEPTGCWAQTAGGYGDGVGTGETGGHWIIEDSRFLHNTSDGLDLLYVREPGSLIEIRRTHAEGNAGNQIKTNGPVQIENSIIIGNCGYFEGQPFTYNVDNCRAYGNALALSVRPGNELTVVNNTITGEGDCLVEAVCEGSCDGSEAVEIRNNIFQGQTDFLQPFEQTCLVYTEGFPIDPLDMDYSVIYEVKGDPCPMGPHDICSPPRLVSAEIDSFDAHLRADSPAIDAGDPAAAPAEDFDSRPRDAAPDIGAYEWTAAPAEAAFHVTLGGDVYAARAFFCGLSSGCFNSGQGADIAEWVPVSEPVEPGDVLELDSDRPGLYRKARGPYSRLAAGVVSSAPGFVLGEPGEHKTLLALLGTALVKATAEGGPIRPGDLLTTSSTSGYAMRCPGPAWCQGALIGKALEPLENGLGFIRMLILR